MILYGAPISPFVRKVFVYAAEKGLELEHKPSTPFAPDPEFMECSPFRKIPAFRDGDFRISDSTAIITYLEAKHPEPALLPADPANRARTIWYDEFADTILVAQAGPIFFNRVVAGLIGQTGDLALAAKCEAEALPPILDYIESVIPASGFLIEDRPTLADISVAGPFANLELADVHVDPAKHPKAAAYVSAIRARPGFVAAFAREKAMLGRA